MKRIIFLFTMSLLCFFAASAQTQYGFVEREMCWDSAGVTTTLYATFRWRSGNEESRFMGYFDKSNVKVVPTTGGIEFGPCDGGVTINPPKDCQVQNRFYFDLVDAPKTYPPNTYYALSAVRVSGDFKVRYDADPEITIESVSGYSFKTKSNTNCTYQQSELYVDPNGGQLLFLIQY